MAQAEKQLLIRLVARADGQPVIAGFGRTLAELAESEGRLRTELRETNAQASRQASLFGDLSGSTRRWLGVLAGAAGLGAIAKQTFDYNQELEGTQIAIAGLLYANNRYTDSLGHVVDSNTAWQAANAESVQLMGDLQRESLKTAATVPQIADAFALVYGALNAAGVKADNSTVLQLTTRLTQTANAMKVPMEQIRQEINSLITGQVTQDSTIAKRLGLDNAAIKQMQANGSLVAEIMRRTDGYAKAAEAQSNTVRGKLVNTIEIVVATLSRAFGPALEKSKGALDGIFQFFVANGDRMVTAVQRIVAAVENIITTTGQWITTHRRLVEEIISIGAVVGVVTVAYGAIGAAIAAITSPIGIAIAAIVGLALVWEQARKYSEIEVGGRPIAAYIRAAAQIVATVVTAALVAIGGAVRVLYNGVRAAFSGLAEIVLAPIQFIAAKVNDLLAAIPASIANRLIPGVESLRPVLAQVEAQATKLRTSLAFGEHVEGAREAVAETASLLVELTHVGAEKAGEALNSKGQLGGVADLVKQGWSAAAGWLNSQLPQLSALGNKAAAALGLTATPNASPHNDPAANAKAQQVAKRLEAEKAEYLRFVNDYRQQANAAGDPLSQALAKIEADRGDALSKLEAQQAKLKGVFSADVFASDRDAVNSAYDAKEAEARRKATESIRNDLITSLNLQRDLTLSSQRETEDRRIALIKNSVARELAEKLAANSRWFDDESQKVAQSTTNEIERAHRIELLDGERKRRDERDRSDADRAMREQTFGFAEYWQKLSDTIHAQWRSIGQLIAETIVQSRSQLSQAINGFLDDLTSGQGDLLKSLGGLSKGLSSLWTKSLTEILMSGRDVAKQLQDLFKSVHVKNEDGTTDYVGTALQGAGIGGAIGGLFQTPNNYAGVGGSIGGAIGAVIGTYFAATGVGAAIGSAIGTAVGSMIQKGQDSIRVAIVNGVATVTEHGISATAREEVQTQIQRKVHEETKSWQSLLDLFPQSIRDHIAAMQASGQLALPAINLNGGVDAADLTDQGALGALTDFLSNDLPRATFDAYRGAISVALDQLGVGSVRLQQLFTYWGTLQGKELHDAVERYVQVTLDAADIRGKINAPFEEKLRIASTYGQTRPLQQLDDITAAIDTAVSHMAGLTDIDDIVAAQGEINRLSQQYYETQLQYLARIQQIQQGLSASIGQQREQIELAGKDDQGKVNFFFQRMLQLRGQLEASTDPEEINRLTQQIQGYVSQAFSIAPNNADMRDRLLGILSDIDGISTRQLGVAQQAVADRDARPASLLEQASELLLKAAGDLANATDPTSPANPTPGTEHPAPPPVEHPIENGERSAVAPSDPKMTQFVDTMHELLAASRNADLLAYEPRTDELIAALRKAQQEQRDSMPTPKDFGDAVRDALAGMEFTAVDQIVVDNGDLAQSVAETAERRVIARLKNDPYAVLPRVA